MAFGTPTDGNFFTSSGTGGTTVTPAYPTGIAANDVLVLLVGMKPSVANGGSVTTPVGWTLIDSITGAGGYGATLGADTGNTNLYAYVKNTVTGTETGSLTVTVANNNICWASIIRVPGIGLSSFSFGTADGQRTTAPTVNVPYTDLLTNGGSAPNFRAGDVAIWAMCVPTDVFVSGFTAQTISSPGTTFATPVEMREPRSSLGNDVGGYFAYAIATAGSSTSAPTVGATVTTTTTTNARGPILLIRLRDTTQPLTPARFDNTNTFYSAVVTQSSPAQDVSPSKYDNTNAFYAATITQTGGGQSLNPIRYDNDNGFYSSTVSSSNALTPSRFDNANAIYGSVASSANALAVGLLSNANTFYQPQVTATGATQNLSPALFSNSNVFYSASVDRGSVTLAPSLYSNAQSFYAASISQTTYTVYPPRIDNINQFFATSVSEADFIRPNTFENQNAFYSASVYGLAKLAPGLLVNSQAFYSPQIISGAAQITFPDYADSGYVDSGYVGLAVQNASAVYSPSARNVSKVLPSDYQNANAFYAHTAVKVAYPLSPERVTSSSAFFTPTVSIEQFLLPAIVGSQNAFPSALVSIQQFVAPALFANANAFYGVEVGSINEVLPQSLPSGNALYAATVSAGPASILPILFVNQNRFIKQSIIWWDNQPDTAESWTAEAEVPTTWDDIPITVETWTPISDTEETWQQAA